MGNNTVIRSPRMLAVLLVAALLNLGTSALATVPTSASLASQPTAMGEIGIDSTRLEARTIRFRFKEAVDATTVDAFTVVLHGPQGMVEAKVTLAEGGLEALVTPSRQLQPGGSHTVFVKGVRTASGRELAMSTLTFVAPEGASKRQFAAAGAAKALDDETWTPQQVNYSGGWKTGRPFMPMDVAAAPRAASGVTALAGRTLRLNGKPLGKVNVRIGNHSTVTDSEGYFLLENLGAGSQTLVVEGASANRDDAEYGYFEILVDVASSKTTVLPYHIWMPKLDVASRTQVASPTREEAVLRSPKIPGLEIRIPKGVVLRDRAGQVVSELTITPIPVDRTPFPQPPMEFPVYFTVQPGGVVLESVDGKRPELATVLYPNYAGAAPGSATNAWLYDPFEKGWHIYGGGKVNLAGNAVELDQGVGLYQFTGGAHVAGPNPGPPGPPCGCGGGSGGSGPDGGGGNGNDSGGGASGVGSFSSEMGGDPVSLSTGIFIQAETDLSLTDLLPLRVERVYRHTNPNLSTFGYGWTSPLDIYLYWPTGNDTKVWLILPNGSQVEYSVVAAQGSNVYSHTASPGEFYGSTLQIAQGGQFWRLRFRDGREYQLGTHVQGLMAYSDRHGNTTRITRNGAGHITRVTGPSGRWIKFTPNANGTISQISDAAGRTYTYSYQSGYLQSVTDPGGGVRSYAYDASNRLRTVTDAASNVVITNDYDANNRVSEQTFANSESMQFAYTVVNGKVAQTDVTDQRGKVRRVLFDSAGFITGSTYPFNEAEEQITTFTRDASGRVLTMTDPLSRSTAYTHDAFGNVATITRMYGTAQAATTSFTYEPYFQQLASVTDPLNHTWTWGFDAARNPVTLTDPLSHVTSFAFNAQGQLTSMTDANNHTWTYSYTGADLATVTDPLSRVTQFHTNAIGQVTHVVNPAGEVSKNEYDAVGRLTKTYDGLGQAVEFVFNTAGQMTAHKDQKLNTTSYTFNNLGLVATKTDALTNAEAYLYGANGKLSRITDRKGQVTGLTYDFANRVSQIGFGATVANPTTYTSTLGYTYDDGDRATTVADSANGNIGRTFDDFDRLTQEVTAEGTVNYTFDAAGRRATMTVAGQTQIVYTWDNANRLTHITQGSDVIQFAYDSAGRRISTTLANAVVQSYGHDDANQLTSITYTKGAANIGDLQYTYDAAGRRIKVSGSLARTNLPAAVASVSYNANNQLTSWAGATHSYDLNGNLASDGSKTFTWNSRDQLTALSGGATASFSYDAAGRRTSKTIGGAQTGFLYDGLNFVQELTGTTPKANLIAAGIDEFFLRRETAATRHPITDALGSVVALTDVAGAMATEYTFEPYGNTTTSGGVDSNSQSYTAREDDATGLFYYRARYYSPTKGRFISSDPIGFYGGSNVYAYVGGKPMNFNDPHGLQAAAGNAGSDDDDRNFPLPEPPKPNPMSPDDRAAMYRDCMDRTYDRYIPKFALACSGIIIATTVVGKGLGFATGVAVSAGIVGTFFYWQHRDCKRLSWLD